MDGSAELFSLRMVKPIGINELQGVVAMIASLARSHERKQRPPPIGRLP
ncbi:MAG TPA: hypothetical protein PK867_11490 [Pirellulales bacterium]|nr:hypothetical protein [Pirellulales bacterium]